MRDIEMDARDVMEQIHMAESRHMQMGALVSYQLQYPDMTIRDFFAMASEELEEQEEDQMNVSNDTNLLPRGCPVAPLKNVSGMIVTPKKISGQFNYCHT